MSFAEDLPYWKTSKTGADGWLHKAVIEIERAGGTVLAEGYGSDRANMRSAFMIRFKLDGDTYRLVWPVLASKWEGSDLKPAFVNAARRQAATMLYHDVKAACVKARALSARVAFFAHLELPGGRVASDLSGPQLEAQFPKLLPEGDQA
jgi:hypothetical protein